MRRALAQHAWLSKELLQIDDLLKVFVLAGW
jgi:hypothetical protein